MSSEIIADADHKMGRAVEAMERDFQGLRTGRASTALVERLHVEYYGTSTPLNQLAGISVPEPHQIVIQPWDRGVLGAIEKAIQKSDIGLMPNVDGTVVRLNIPPLTEERRKDIVRSVHKRMEEARVEIRNLRREAADHLKREERDGDGRDRRGPPPARNAAAHDRPAHRRGRPPGRREGTGGPRGLVARAPLARPTDAPPAAHEPVRETDRPADRVARRRHAAAPERGAAATRRDHHGRQSPLGASARPVRARRSRGRRRGDPRAPAPRGAARRPGPDPVRVQPRELGPLGRGGDRPVRPARGGDPQRDRRAPCAGRPHPAARSARRAAPGDPRVDRGGPRGDRRRRPAAAQHRLQLRRPDRARRRVPPARLERHPAPTTSTRPRSARPCTRSACPIRTWSSGPAASSACPTS